MVWHLRAPGHAHAHSGGSGLLAAVATLGPCAGFSAALQTQEAESEPSCHHLSVSSIPVLRPHPVTCDLLPTFAALSRRAVTFQALPRVLREAPLSAKLSTARLSWAHRALAKGASTSSFLCHIFSAKQQQTKSPHPTLNPHSSGSLLRLPCLDPFSLRFVSEGPCLLLPHRSFSAHSPLHLTSGALRVFPWKALLPIRLWCRNH